MRPKIKVSGSSGASQQSIQDVIKSELEQLFEQAFSNMNRKNDRVTRDYTSMCVNAYLQGKHHAGKVLKWTLVSDTTNNTLLMELTNKILCEVWIVYPGNINQYCPLTA
jgi:DNA phosphorothioation-dependent restriction protein DptG